MIGWNRPASKIISRLIILRFLLGLTPTWAIPIWSNRNRVEQERGDHCMTMRTKACNISETVQDRTEVANALSIGRPNKISDLG